MISTSEIEAKNELNLAVSTFRLKNFKAIRGSGPVHFTPLTVLMGANGVGLVRPFSFDSEAV